MGRPERRRLHGERAEKSRARELLRLGPLFGRREHERKHVGNRRSGIAALGEREASAEHEQTAATLADEIRNHSQLVMREIARFDTAEDEASIFEELLARFGEAARKLFGIIDVETQEFALRGALQTDDLQILVIRDGAADELELEARLAFEVQDFGPFVLDIDELVALIILRDHLTLFGRNTEAEDARSGVGGGEMNAHRRRLRGKLDLARAHDTTVVFDV